MAYSFLWNLCIAAYMSCLDEESEATHWIGLDIEGAV
jgi:hypothetical protein